jgi:hypothetical protein
MDADRLTSQSIVHALRLGLVPARGLEHIVVGRESELAIVRRDLEFSKRGGGWVRFFGGPHGAGKTFICSLVRELAWREGFIVATIDLGPDGPMHKREVIYHRMMKGMRSHHIRDVPAFEFIVQEWLFALQQDIQRTIGLNSAHPNQWSELSALVEQEVGKRLVQLQIYNTSLANALRAYYRASHQANEPLMTAATQWLTGEPHDFTELRREFDITGTIAKENAFEFLQAMGRLIVHIGYAGLLLICDEADLISRLARPDNRLAAYENMRSLMDGTAHGTFPHCGFLFAGSEDLFHDGIRGIAAYPPLSQRLKLGRARRPAKDDDGPIIMLNGFDRQTLHYVALKIRDVHAIAYDWHASARLTNELMSALVESAAGRFGEGLTAAPRGFFKVLVDILDEVRQHPQTSAIEVVKSGIDPERIEEVEREDVHLLDHDLL